MTSSGNHSSVEQIQDAPVSNPFKSSNSSSQISGPLPAQGSSFRSRVSFSAGTPTGEPTSFMGHSRQPSTASSFNFQQNRVSSFHPSAGAMTPGGVSFASSSHLRHRKAFESRALDPDQTPEKPWLLNIDRKKSDRKAYWIFVIAIIMGILGFMGIVYSGYASVPRNKYCLTMQDDFNGDSIDKSIWFHEEETGGFGNHEFEWTTDSTNNSFVEDGKLYIVPTLTSDALGEAAIIDGYNLNLTQSNLCTASNRTDASCAKVSNLTTGAILPPIQSARLITNFSRTIKYGRVEVTAKLPTGDWIWPAVWLMPKDSVYGSWPQSGEIDIVESKGNVAKERSDVLTNAFRSSLHWGTDTNHDQYSKTTDIRRLYSDFYNEGFHTFGMEWTPEGIYTYEGSPVHKVLSVKFDEPFWTRGDFPSSTANGTQIVDPWSGATDRSAAPFDEEFYLILNVAVGGTNGYFEDGKKDDKPWSNNGLNAVSDFWKAKDQWYPTWGSPKDRAMVVDSVKMWQLC